MYVAPRLLATERMELRFDLAKLFGVDVLAPIRQIEKGMHLWLLYNNSDHVMDLAEKRRRDEEIQKRRAKLDRLKENEEAIASGATLALPSSEPMLMLEDRPKNPGDI